MIHAIVDYDVRGDKMVVKGPAFSDANNLLGTGSLNEPDNVDLIKKYQESSNTVLSSTVRDNIKSQIEASIDFSLSKSILLDIEINGSDVGNIFITSFNTDGTLTKATKTGGSLSSDTVRTLIDIGKEEKWFTMGKCPNCVKTNWFTGSLGNAYNFVGSVGGEWNGLYKNNQKVYQLDIPNYATASTYGNFETYIIYWKPNCTFSGTDFNGNSLSFSNKHKWVAVPESYYNTTTPLDDTVFFHVLDDFAARCPRDTSGSAAFNFKGKRGFFKLDLNYQQVAQDKYGKFKVLPCPLYAHEPGNEVNYGYNCHPVDGCVSAPSGTTGTYTTLADCEDNCATGSQPTSSTYNCTPNGCVLAPSGTTGTYSSFVACQQSCSYVPPTASLCKSCSFSQLDNFDFSSGSQNYFVTGASYHTAYGGMSIGVGPSSSGVGLNSTTGTSNVYISQSVHAFQSPCTYSICFEAYQQYDNPLAGIIIDTGLGTGSSQYQEFINIPTVPTAYNLILNAPPTGSSAYGDFIMYFFNNNNTLGSRITVDNICIEQLSCPPSGDITSSHCIITGSAYCFTSQSYDCLCPSGSVTFTSGGVDYCVNSSSIAFSKNITSGTPITTTPAIQWQYGVYGYPRIYYTHSIWGASGSTAIGTGTNANPQFPSPYFGSDYVYNTSYTFDLVKADFWRGYNGFTRTGVVNCNDSIGNGKWFGGGKFIKVDSPTTYYYAILADDAWRVILNGQIHATTVLRTGSYSNWNTPKQLMAGAFQLRKAHYAPGCGPFNPYLTSSLLPTCGGNNTSGFGGNWAYRSLAIIPVTFPSGCNYISFEALDMLGGAAGIGAFLLDNTSEEIISASNENDLNIIYDSRVDPTFVLDQGQGNVTPVNFQDWEFSPNPGPFTSASITASCPTNVPISVTEPGPCGLCFTTSSLKFQCGDCIECHHGRLYNGYVMDKGGIDNAGRGIGGIVNISATSNSINAWVVPGEIEWNNLVTSLNSGVAPANILATGQLNVPGVGGQLKDYTRDLTASCWEFPNAGAQTGTNSSGWAGTAAGTSNNTLTFSGLGLEGYWWSVSSSAASNKAFTRELFSWSTDVYRNERFKNNGYSLRLCRPTASGEINGQNVIGAYVGNDGTSYDGVVIGDNCWITKNLSETKYNNSSAVTLTTNSNTWLTAMNNPVSELSCFYNNTSSNDMIIKGNIDPTTNLCRVFPKYYIYKECNSNRILIQRSPGSVSTSGSVEKAPDGTCWGFIESTTTSPTVTATIFSETNYFSGSGFSPYNNCEDCLTPHTLYVTFSASFC